MSLSYLFFLPFFWPFLLSHIIQWRWGHLRQRHRACGSHYLPRVHFMPLVPSGCYKPSVMPRGPIGWESRVLWLSYNRNTGHGSDFQDLRRFQENESLLCHLQSGKASWGEKLAWLCWGSRTILGRPKAGFPVLVRLHHSRALCWALRPVNSLLH